MKNPKLPIHNMAQRHYGLVQEVAEYWTQGACVCLDRHHQPPAVFQIIWAERRTDAIIEWEPTDERTKDSWANENDATEAGAYACVLAAVELLEGLVAVRRAEVKTGADYYVAPPGTQASDLENCIRLEISEIDRGNAATVVRRLNDKLEQTTLGNSNLPAIAGVVGFRAQLIRLADLEE